MFSRRTILANTFNGLGMLALSDMLQADDESSVRNRLLLVLNMFPVKQNDVSLYSCRVASAKWIRMNISQS